MDGNETFRRPGVAHRCLLAQGPRGEAVQGDAGARDAGGPSKPGRRRATERPSTGRISDTTDALHEARSRPCGCASRWEHQLVSPLHKDAVSQFASLKTARSARARCPAMPWEFRLAQRCRVGAAELAAASNG